MLRRVLIFGISESWKCISFSSIHLLYEFLEALDLNEGMSCTAYKRDPMRHCSALLVISPAFFLCDTLSPCLITQMGLDKQTPSGMGLAESASWLESSSGDFSTCPGQATDVIHISFVICFCDDTLPSLRQIPHPRDTGWFIQNHHHHPNFQWRFGCELPDAIQQRQRWEWRTCQKWYKCGNFEIFIYWPTK